MDTPQSVVYNGVVALTLLTCATPFILAALAMLWLGPARWPQSMRQAWERVPEQYRKIVARLQPMLWLLVGIFVGSSLVNPVARWLRTLMP